jgi:hypothetical protein
MIVIDKVEMFDNIETCRKKMMCYSAIGFGIPTAMLISILVIDQMKLFEILPGIGTHHCFLTIHGAQVLPFCLSKKM